MNTKTLRVAAALVVCGTLALAACRQNGKEPLSESEQRAQQLIKGLTIEQKAGLMLHQSQAVEELGIPGYNWWNEALHGVARAGKATVFPMPIAMAASFDEPLVYEVFSAVSDEARVKYRQAVETGHVDHYQGLTFWTPNINIFRDPRWGRGMETYGEDPYLTGQLGMAVVRGLQGPTDSPMVKAHACAKHFAVHSGPEWNRHSYDARVSERDLRETYLPAFKDLVTKAGVKEVMTAYNRFRGEPCAASDYLVNTILRGEWGYKGLIVSDCWAIHDFFREGAHGFAPDMAHAAAQAVHNGTDLNCGMSYEAIPEAVKQGLLDEADVDRSLVRLLSARDRLGELDHDNGPWNYLQDSIVEGAEHRALARKMAAETFVLLQNKGGILPLDKTEKVALIGPNSDDKEMQWGNYNGIPEQTSTLREALAERIPGLVYLRGCGLTDGAEPEVLKALADKDIVIFAGGISPRLEGEEMPVEVPGFRGGDRVNIELPAVQRELIKTLHDAGKKVILVNFSGSAMGLVPETENCEAILQAWYPGEEGGEALADVLTGVLSPSGKLPLTFYRNIEQLPDFEDYTMKGRTYRYFSGSPLFAFGHGLSYTSFEYGSARIRRHVLDIEVSNTGSRDATEVVQVYVRRPGDAEGPLKTLRGFKRVEIPAGQTVTVSFLLTPETFLAWSGEKQDMVPCRGEWEILYGGSSDSLKTIAYKNR